MQGVEAIDPASLNLTFQVPNTEVMCHLSGGTQGAFLGLTLGNWSGQRLANEGDVI